jgi:hypothetical protein
MILLHPPRSYNFIGSDWATALACHLEGLTNLQSLDLRYERERGREGGRWRESEREPQNPCGGP